MKVLVPLDGSRFSEAVLGRVAQLVEAVDAEALLLTVVEEPKIGGTWLEAIPMVDEATGAFGMAGMSYLRDLPDPSVASAETREQMMARALNAAEERLAQVAASWPSLRTRTRAVHGDDPASAITAIAQEEDVDLIAMSTHGRSGLGRWVYGSNAGKLLLSASVPLFLLRPRDGGETALERKPIDTILVPLDGSALAELALSHAEALAEPMGVKLSLVQVVTTPTMAYPSMEGYAFDPQMVESIESAAVSYLNEKQAELQMKGFDVDCTVKVGFPADHIVDLAAENDGTLIVMCTHGRSGLGRWIMGSVADRVLRSSHSPVLLIRPQE